MKKITLIILCCMVVAGCTNESKAERALNAAGYSNIRFTGYSMFSCSEDDFFSTGFAAKGPTGVTVSGAVCSSFFTKGSTIRLD